MKPKKIVLKQEKKTRKMRYFLRKYREKINQFKPVQLCFDENISSSQTEVSSNIISPAKADQLTSIPEHSTTISNDSAQKIIKSPKLTQIITRSKTRQAQSNIKTTITTQSSPTLTLTLMSKKLLNACSPKSKIGIYQQPMRTSIPRSTTSNRRSSGGNNSNTKSNMLVKQKSINIDESSDDEDDNEKMCDETTIIQTPKIVQSPNAKLNYSSDSDDDPKKSSNHSTGTTPPHKKFRKLRLFDTPHTPKTLFKKSSFNYDSDKPVSPVTCRLKREKSPLSSHHSADECLQPPLRSRLFGNYLADESIVPSLSTEKLRSPSPFQPQANINPFTPNNSTNHNTIQPKTNILFASNSLVQITTLNTFRSSASKRERASMEDMGDDEHSDDIPKNKRLALRQCAVSRYHEEFHEVCKLGSGEFGDVFKCINRLDGCTYAIKRSKKPIAGSALEIAAWKEVCAHAVLVKHNHIVQYYSAWAEADRMLIQNEYCNGGSLAEYLEQNKLNSEVMNEVELKSIVLHIARGLSYMHSLNLVHLDIKPGNIFMCRNPRNPILNEESGIESEQEDINCHETITYKIGDLGHVTSTLDSHIEEGDCRYLPNEILQEQYNYLTKADVFALSLTVYVCGSNDDLPKNGDEWHWIRRGNLKDLPQCTDRFKKLLIQMINGNPILRPSATTLIHHPCICPDASKNKAQLLKELNQEKFKNEMLQRKVREYEQKIQVPTPPPSKATPKFARSMSCNLIS